MVIKRKSAIYSVIALMLCVAVYLNWSYQRGGEEGEAMQTSQTDDNKILGESQLVDKTESGEEPLETASGEKSRKSWWSSVRVGKKARWCLASAVRNTRERWSCATGPTTPGCAWKSPRPFAR